MRRRLETLTAVLLLTVVPPPYVNSKPDKPRVDPERYLAQFGYLPYSSLETSSRRSAAELRSAIRNLQHMAGLEASGEMDAVTLRLMRSPRCGVSDFQGRRTARRSSAISSRALRHERRRVKRWRLGSRPWNKHALTYRILNYTPDLQQRETERAIEQAFHVWSVATRLHFRKVYSGSADVMIKFATRTHLDGYPFDGPGLILAHAFYPGEAAKDGDVHFDDDELWTVASSSGTNLPFVAAHEIGHSLGLAHSDVVGALMYPWYQGTGDDVTLSQDDITAIQKLYGKTSDKLPPVVPSIYPEVSPTLLPEDPGSTPDPKLPPDVCSTNFDGMGVVRSEIMLFKGNWFWRLDEKAGLLQNYPAEVERFWYDLPRDSRVDAVVELYSHPKILFFSGDRYWAFDGNYMNKYFPREGRPLSHLGLPVELRKIDAAFTWSHNHKTYLVSGDMYWRLNNSRVEYDYPRDIGVWGLRLPVDGALDFRKELYFVRGRKSTQLNSRRMKLRHTKSATISKRWLQLECRTSDDDDDDEEGIVSEPRTTGSANSSATKTVTSIIVASFVTIF